MHACKHTGPTTRVSLLNRLPHALPDTTIVPTHSCNQSDAQSRYLLSQCNFTSFCHLLSIIVANHVRLRRSRSHPRTQQQQPLHLQKSPVQSSESSWSSAPGALVDSSIMDSRRPSDENRGHRSSNDTPSPLSASPSPTRDQQPQRRPRRTLPTRPVTPSSSSRSSQSPDRFATHSDTISLTRHSVPLSLSSSSSSSSLRVSSSIPPAHPNRERRATSPGSTQNPPSVPKTSPGNDRAYDGARAYTGISDGLRDEHDDGVDGYDGDCAGSGRLRRALSSMSMLSDKNDSTWMQHCEPWHALDTAVRSR